MQVPTVLRALGPHLALARVCFSAVMHLVAGPGGPAKCTFSPTTGVLERALTILGPRESKAGRDTRTRLRRFNSMGLCEGGNGQHCTFLASTSRKQLPHILQKLRYRGACAELASGEATTPR